MCVPGYAFNNVGICTMCPYGSQPSSDQSTCVCSSSTQYFNQSSFNCTQCPANSYANQSSCVCFPGYIIISGSCAPPSQNCSINQIINGDKCMCVPGYAFNNAGICTMCPSGSQPSSDQTTCTCNSRTQYFNLSTFTCSQCPPNSYASQMTCVCSPGYTLISGNCVSSQTCK
jgi:hypothetical protein